jgi:hypothetical protein
MRSSVSVVLAAAVLALAGCADFHRGPAPLDGGGNGDGAQVADLAFEKLVYPIMEMDCVDCHSASGEASNSSFVLTGDAQLDRAVVVALVTPGNPTNSRLLIQATSVSHEGGVRFTNDSVEYQTIAAWIQGLGVTAP